MIVQVRAPVAEFQQRHDRKIDDRIKRRGRSFRIFGAVATGCGSLPARWCLRLGQAPCWLSHLLNRFGCKTLAVYVSATALKIGRELFESDPRTNWAVGPEFITYDGHRLPLEDDSVDKVVIYDAFHHIPNAAEVLREVARVLRDGGIVGMREPGARHASTEKALGRSA